MNSNLWSWGKLSQVVLSRINVGLVAHVMLSFFFSGHPLLNGHLRRSQWCPLNRGFHCTWKVEVGSGVRDMAHPRLEIRSLKVL